MKRGVVAAVFLSVLMMASVAMAGLVGQTGPMSIDRLNGYWYDNGGEFNIYNSGLDASSYNSTLKTAVNGGFETFCIEYDEHVSIPSSAYYKVNTKAVDGGADNTGPDTISVGTAWLYSQFAKGTLTDYNYTPGAGRVDSAKWLQKAIWYLEGEITLATAGGIGAGGNKFLNAVVTQFTSLDNADNDVTNFAQYNVYALNLTTGPNGTGGLLQDQLYYHVTEPASLFLLGLGLLGAAALRRNFKRF